LVFFLQKRGYQKKKKGGLPKQRKGESQFLAHTNNPTNTGKGKNITKAEKVKRRGNKKREINYIKN